VVLEPDPLIANFIVDSVATCVGNHGQLSLDISGGSPISQPYLTLWTNANGDTLNEQSTNNFATTVGSLPSGVYHVRIEDDNGCVIHVDTTLAPAICGSTLNLTAFIEGYYMTSSTMAPVLFNEGVTSNQNVTDTIKVVLHNSVSPFSVVASAAAVLNTNGTASCFFPGISGSYYIAIKHRNAVETWSANPVLFNAPTINYHFSTNANQAYGDNMIAVDPGVWALYSGDISADQNIDLLDLAILESDINSFQFGYFATDINGDGNVDLLDAPLLEDNINNFIFSVHP
jgi:hypothetical protein